MKRGLWGETNETTDGGSSEIVGLREGLRVVEMNESVSAIFRGPALMVYELWSVD